MGWPGPVTDRQFQAWGEWLHEENNRPGRVEQLLTLLLKTAHGIEVKWETPAIPAQPKGDDGDGMISVLSALAGVIGDIGNIKGGDKLAARIAEMNLGK